MVSQIPGQQNVEIRWLKKEKLTRHKNNSHIEEFYEFYSSVNIVWVLNRGGRNGRTSSTHGGERKCVHFFGGRGLKGEQLRDRGVDERKILKWTVGVIGGRVLDSYTSG